MHEHQCAFRQLQLCRASTSVLPVTHATRAPSMKGEWSESTRIFSQFTSYNTKN